MGDNKGDVKGENNARAWGAKEGDTMGAIVKRKDKNGGQEGSNQDEYVGKQEGREEGRGEGEGLGLGLRVRA